MLVAIHGFFSRICDPRFGGTYMTLLNTVNTLGWAVPKTLALKLVGVLTIYKCTDNALDSSSTSNLQNVSRGLFKIEFYRFAVDFDVVGT